MGKSSSLQQKCNESQEINHVHIHGGSARGVLSNSDLSEGEHKLLVVKGDKERHFYLQLYFKILG